MLVLVSPKNFEEAIEAVEGGADIIDVKNPAEGSLGANFPWVIKKISNFVKPLGREVSAAVGDMDFKPGTASLSAYAAAYCGADYVKVGLYGVKTKIQATEIARAVVKSLSEFKSKVVLAAYADSYIIDSLSPLELPEIAATSDVDVVMIDTAIKDGKTLFDCMDFESVAEFVDKAHEYGLMCALAGSVKLKHIPMIKKAKADIVGVRGAVCEKGRNGKLKRELVEKFVKTVKSKT